VPCRNRNRGGGDNKGPKRQKEVSADYKAEPEGLRLYSKITGLSNERVERLKTRSEVMI